MFKPRPIHLSMLKPSILRSPVSFIMLPCHHNNRSIFNPCHPRSAMFPIGETYVSWSSPHDTKAIYNVGDKIPLSWKWSGYSDYTSVTIRLWEDITGLDNQLASYSAYLINGNSSRSGSQLYWTITESHRSIYDLYFELDYGTSTAQTIRFRIPRELIVTSPTGLIPFSTGTCGFSRFPYAYYIKMCLVSNQVTLFPFDGKPMASRWMRYAHPSFLSPKVNLEY
jgi:hypothetical protein